MKPIQLFVPTYRVDECLREMRECLEKGWTGLGFKTLEFEAAWKQYTGPFVSADLFIETLYNDLSGRKTAALIRH